MFLVLVHHYDAMVEVGRESERKDLKCIESSFQFDHTVFVFCFFVCVHGYVSLVVCLCPCLCVHVCVCVVVCVFLLFL